jgi:hypothetical protein
MPIGKRKNSKKKGKFEIEMSIKSWLSNIVFWIALFFIIRLFGISNPPLEVEHNWRQTTVTMVARNFLEVDAHILYPRIDIAGEKTGITGMEFPVLNYSIFLVSKVFGYQHWYGRFINLLITSLGLWFFYALCTKYFDKRVAFYATVILMCSIWFQFARKIMPDTFAMSFLIASIYFASNYLEQKGHQILNLLLYSLLACLGIMAKLPAGYLLIIFALWVFNPKITLGKKIIFASVTILILIPVVWWYFIWVPHLVENYGFEHFFMGKGFSQGISEISHNLNITFSRFYDTALKFIGFACFLLGLYFIIKNRNRILGLSLFLCTIGFAVIMFKAGFTFYHHSYYIIPFAPIMALVAAYGLCQIKNPKMALIILTAVVIENIANQQHDFFIKPKEQALLSLDKDLEQAGVAPDDLIIINSDQYPTPMYFSHRKGWVDNNYNINKQGYIDSLANHGLKYIVILKRSFGSELLLKNRKAIFDNENYTFYKVADNQSTMK